MNDDSLAFGYEVLTVIFSNGNPEPRTGNPKREAGK
jgi:hypothetical protein